MRYIESVVDSKGSRLAPSIEGRQAKGAGFGLRLGDERGGNGDEARPGKEPFIQGHFRWSLVVEGLGQHLHPEKIAGHKAALRVFKNGQRPRRLGFLSPDRRNQDACVKKRADQWSTPTSRSPLRLRTSCRMPSISNSGSLFARSSSTAFLRSSSSSRPKSVRGTNCSVSVAGSAEEALTMLCIFFAANSSAACTASRSSSGWAVRTRSTSPQAASSFRTSSTVTWVPAMTGLPPGSEVIT